VSLTFHAVAAVGDVTPQTVLRAEVGDEDIAVFNLDGAYYAIKDMCTHGEARLSEGYIEGDEIECSYHAGRFEIKTGKASQFPCVVDVESYPVKVENDMILVGIESSPSQYPLGPQ
jgi:nitrite reductase/ring-hydroxylating ferredoxin subunit